VARSILENGPSTAAALAERLELTPAAVRRHLEHLTESGTVEGREQKVYGSRGRGRPARVFALTDAGRDAFDQQYDDLAVAALRFLAETQGEEAVVEFARRRVARLRRGDGRRPDADPGRGAGPGLHRRWLRRHGA
jgi:predicted ArsR family transcriptional regulator